MENQLETVELPPKEKVLATIEFLKERLICVEQSGTLPNIYKVQDELKYWKKFLVENYNV